MIAQRLADVNARLTAACTANGRAPAEVHLIAVSKTFPASAIRECYAAGQRDFGENYAQELRDKARELADLADLRWHFIGRLQVNKAKYVAPVAFRTHAVDAVDQAAALVARAAGPVDVLLAVNTGREPQKGGALPEHVVARARELAAVAGVRFRGLMTLPPYDDDPEVEAPFYALLESLAADVRAAGLPVDELSMGMSHDFEVAVRYGRGTTTWVRVGTAIFGERT